MHHLLAHYAGIMQVKVVCAQRLDNTEECHSVLILLSVEN